MFISSRKSFEIREGEKKLLIPRNYIGGIPKWAESHWMIQAAIRDGSIATPDSTSDKSLEAAEKTAAEQEGQYDLRPEDGKKPTENSRGKN